MFDRGLYFEVISDRTIKSSGLAPSIPFPNLTDTSANWASHTNRFFSGGMRQPPQG